MKNVAGVFFSLMILSCFLSCRSTKKFQKAVNKKDSALVITSSQDSKDFLKIAKKVLDNLNSNHINFKTFSAKIHVEYEDSKGKKPDVNAFVRMYKDSVIWMSINATFLNIEAFRILITKDSVTILNKLDKQVDYKPLSFVQDIAKIPLDFKTLQDLIVGNPIYIGKNIVAYKQTENHILVSTTGEFFKNLLTLTTNNNNLIERSKLDDIGVAQNRTADLTYDQYENKSGTFFSTFREIVVAEKTKVDIRLDFKQYEFNKDLSFPFSVPKNYKRK
jgi:hypothetical protein